MSIHYMHLGSEIVPGSSLSSMDISSAGVSSDELAAALLTKIVEDGFEVIPQSGGPRQFILLVNVFIKKASPGSKYSESFHVQISPAQGQISEVIFGTTRVTREHLATDPIPYQDFIIAPTNISGQVIFRPLAEGESPPKIWAPTRRVIPEPQDVKP